MKLSIIIPVYNESGSIAELLNGINAVKLDCIDKEIIIVDDFSTDGSREIIKNSRGDYVKIFQDKNMGKGSALKKGIEASTGDFTIFQDADLEYTPQDYAKLLTPILEKRTNITLGSRFINERLTILGENKTINPLHWIGNRILTFTFNTLYKQKLSDVEPCYKVFRTELLKKTPVASNRFEYDIELMCKLVKKGERIVQLPIKYNPRTDKEGKKIKWTDGFIALWTIIKYRFVY